MSSVDLFSLAPFVYLLILARAILCSLHLCLGLFFLLVLCREWMREEGTLHIPRYRMYILPPFKGFYEIPNALIPL